MDKARFLSFVTYLKARGSDLDSTEESCSSIERDIEDLGNAILDSVERKKHKLFAMTSGTGGEPESNQARLYSRDSLSIENLLNLK